MKIGELARAAGTDVETIRYYERAGLLAAPPRTDAGYRAYGDDHLEALRFIRHCRSLDMPLADAKRLGELAHDTNVTCEDANQLIEAHLTRVHARIHELQALEQQLLHLQAQCHSRHETSDCGILRALMQGAHGEACACHNEIDPIEVACDHNHSPM
ncbi:Cd(II)/Pb(II)-responsive transcriptional regulator [Pandoraea sp. XY-2]|uniref:Cd(II)/Pb(II)-responsive transcriptional regulator n=1 Tax=Pandoraea sp. XY-2 TaxID=2518599 RepID=UPI00101B18AD|nr:Cd(II)/Pb(II)-responsive transcriptional regulator [Pandoraea sp. XY-2]QBC31709.1 Cd(II)/Pb(II)-responsive transcriptional regulator [Pandoraea sp. XY-2]